MTKNEASLWCEQAVARTHFDSVAKYYDYIMGWYEIPANRKTLRDVAQECQGRDSFHVVDIGCGTGLGLLEWARRSPGCAKHTAVDSSEAMIERSSMRLRAHSLDHKVTFHHGLAEDLPFANESVDAIFSSFMLDMHDRPKRLNLLQEAARVLKPGAKARWVVMDSKPKSLIGRILSWSYTKCYGRWNWLWMFFFPNYAPHCRPIDLAKDLTSAGFDILEKRNSYVTFFPVAIFVTTKVS